MVCVTTMTVMRERFNQKRVTIMLPCIMRVCERLLAEGYLTRDGLMLISTSGALIAVSAAQLLHEGAHLRFMRDVDVGFDIITAGEMCAVFHIGEGLGDVTLQLEKPHAGLIHYGNTITLLPLVTTELTQALEVVP